MGQLKYLVLHCSATPEGRTLTSGDIRRMHTAPKPIGRGWSQVGYSDMIHIDGSIENLVPYDDNDLVDRWEITNGARGYNGIARHVVYVGGCKKNKPKEMKWYPAKDTRTNEQNDALEEYVKDFICVHPTIKVIGHNQVANKACPSFDVPTWLRSIGVAEQNIGL